MPTTVSESLNPGSRVPPVRVLAPAASYDTRRWEATLLMANVWQQLGFDVDVRDFPDFATLLATVSSEPSLWEAYVTGYLGRPQRLDPDELLFRPFHCSGITEFGANMVGYCNPPYDAVVEAQRATLDQEAWREQRSAWRRRGSDSISNIGGRMAPSIFRINIYIQLILPLTP